MKRLFLTGAGGFVGAHTLIHLLHNTDWELVLTDSFQHMGKTDRVTHMLESHPEYIPRVTVLTHDLTAPISAQFIDRMGPIDYVINMASESSVDRSIIAPREFVNNNVNLMHTMLEYARDNPVKKFLQVSTDEVYGPAPQGYDHIEGDYHRPSNPYAASKAMQEDLGWAYWRTYGLPYMQSNTMNILGQFQDPEKLVPRVIKSVLDDEVMPIFADNNKAAGTRKYLHARNQADALLFILKNVEPNSYPKDDAPSIFNVVGNTEMSNLDMALLIASYIGKELKYEMVPVYEARPGHDLRYSLNGTKLEELGWKAPMAFEESLRTIVEWYMEPENRAWLL